MKKAIKIMSVIMVIAMLVSIATPIFATSLGGLTSMKPDYDSNTATGVKSIGSKVLGIVTVIGIVVSVIVIAGLGIKYITGSAEEKAEYKKSFVPLLVGMILLLGASTIAAFLVNTANIAS